jgi:hypothetical protein
MEIENIADDETCIKKSKEFIGFKFRPVLRRTKYSQKDSDECLKFKKSLLKKPVVNFVDSVYVSRDAKMKKKLLVVKPFDRNHFINVHGPVLGKKTSYEKRSVSVAPVKKEAVPSFFRYDDLTLPILSIRHKKYKSKE